MHSEYGDMKFSPNTNFIIFNINLIGFIHILRFNSLAGALVKHCGCWMATFSVVCLSFLRLVTEQNLRVAQKALRKHDEIDGRGFWLPAFTTLP